MTEQRTYTTGYAPALSTLKGNLRITGTDLDTDLEFKLKAAIESAERFVGMTIAKSSYTLTTALASTVQLRTPFIGLTSVAVDGVTLSSDKYTISSNGLLAIDASVTGTTITVVYNAGYTYVPIDMQQAIILHASSLFLNPTDSVENLPKASSKLLRPFRSWGLNRL